MSAVIAAPLRGAFSISAPLAGRIARLPTETRTILATRIRTQLRVRTQAEVERILADLLRASP